MVPDRYHTSMHNRREFLAAAVAGSGIAAAQNKLRPATLSQLQRAANDTARRILIQGGIVLSMDARTGNLSRGDVLVEGSRITAIGAALSAAARGSLVVDATDRIVMPGFIDTHSHHDRSLTTAPDALAMVSQGITTIVVGQDGGGQKLAELFARLDRAPASVNVAAFAGHGPLREQVMGADTARVATPAEVERMKPLLQAELDAGALGLSTGLEYDPGIYSDPSEVLALAQVAGAAGGRPRSVAARIVAKQEFAGYWEYVVDEAIFTAPSHPNWGGTAMIGAAGELLGIGSLQLQQATDTKNAEHLNMVVPIDLLKPIFNDLLTQLEPLATAMP